MAKRKRNSSNNLDEEENNSKASIVSTDSFSSSDDRDWNHNKKEIKSLIETKPVKKTIKQEVDEDMDEREEAETEDDFEEFNDGYDENLMGDEDDHKRLALMTEKEREQQLFNRSEARETLKTRFEIEKRLRMAHKREVKESQTDASQRSTERRRNMEDKRNIKDVIKDLKQIREKKKLKQQRLRAADVYSSDSDSDDDKNAGRKSSSLSTSYSSDDWDDQKPKTRTKVLKKKYEGVEDWNLTINDMNAIRLSRHKMEEWCHYPFFKDTVIGCFVRINIGLNPNTKVNVYIVAQITEVTETPKVYNLGKTLTNKGIKLLHGRQPERVYHLEFVSDKRFSPQEYQQWMENMAKDKCELPSKQFIERKKRDIENALNYQIKDSDIDSKVQEKERFDSRPVNFAMKKIRLLKDKELAQRNGDNQKVEHILQEIDELESEANKIDKKRSQNMAAISYINERNRKRNIKEAEKALVEESAQMKNTMKDDPFTRRKCTPTMNRFIKIKTEVDSVTEDETQKLCNKSQTEENDNDLFSAHNFDIDIDLVL